MVLFGGVVAEIAQSTQAGAQWMATFRRKLRSSGRRNFSKGAIKLVPAKVHVRLTALKVTALDAVNELLNHVGWGADDGSERCAIIGVCRSHITENIDKIATTREQAFALIDEVAQQMKTDWDETHDVVERK